MKICFNDLLAISGQHQHSEAPCPPKGTIVSICFVVSVATGIFVGKGSNDWLGWAAGSALFSLLLMLYGILISTLATMEGVGHLIALEQAKHP